jgi:hypothetical protein
LTSDRWLDFGLSFATCNLVTTLTCISSPVNWGDKDSCPHRRIDTSL